MIGTAKLIARLRRRRPRARMAWLGLWALLLQQLALVAYACPLQVQAVEVDRSTAVAGCEAMSAPDPDAPALCDRHCQRDHVATPDSKPPQVPFQPALAVFTRVQALSSPVQAQFYRDVPVCVSDPPPAQRFCSLQI